MSRLGREPRRSTFNDIQEPAWPSSGYAYMCGSSLLTNALHCNEKQSVQSICAPSAKLVGARDGLSYPVVRRSRNVEPSPQEQVLAVFSVRRTDCWRLPGNQVSAVLRLANCVSSFAAQVARPKGSGDPLQQFYVISFVAFAKAQTRRLWQAPRRSCLVQWQH